MIRLAKQKDIARIAEILVFTKRVNFRPIFQDDAYSFNELQVVSVMKEYEQNPRLLQHTWVYDDGIIKGMIHIEEDEIKKLYVDTFFASMGIGAKLITFAITTFDVVFLWALEANTRGLAFYKTHGFEYQGIWQYEEGTSEHLLKLERKQEVSL